MRLVDGDGAIGANSRQIFVFLETELRVVNDPCLIVPDLEEHRVYFCARPATGA